MGSKKQGWTVSRGDEVVRCGQVCDGGVVGRGLGTHNGVRAEGESEIICRWFFEEIFGAKFPKTRPKWLKNRKTGGQMELDGYCDALKLAFEFNGPQHYMFYPKYHKTRIDFLEQLERDKLKLKLCQKHGIILIIVPYTLSYNDFQEFITREYERLTGKRLENHPKRDWKNFKSIV